MQAGTCLPRTVMVTQILKLFSLLGSHTILVFPYQMVWQYSNGDSITGTLNTRAVWKNCDIHYSTNISLYLRDDTRYSHMEGK